MARAMAGSWLTVAALLLGLCLPTLAAEVATPQQFVEALVSTTQSLQQGADTIQLTEDLRLSPANAAGVQLPVQLAGNSTLTIQGGE